MYKTQELKKHLSPSLALGDLCDCIVELEKEVFFIRFFFLLLSREREGKCVCVCLVKRNRCSELRGTFSSANQSEVDLHV